MESVLLDHVLSSLERCAESAPVIMLTFLFFWGRFKSRFDIVEKKTERNEKHQSEFRKEILQRFDIFEKKQDARFEKIDNKIDRVEEEEKSTQNKVSALAANFDTYFKLMHKFK